MTQFLLVCIAGGLGSGARYLTGLAANRWLGNALPFGTLIVNVLGCFFIALVLQSATAALTPMHRIVIATGFLGGFTTYSAFNHELLRFVTEGAPGKAAAYLAVTTIGCAVAGFAGLWLAR
ncbi:MAG: CrcB family protein [Myxococcota bacterium]|nr:CrcB family protein [Myxococcota bacterium]